MRVAYITSAPLISGAERNLQDILRLAPDTGIDPVVICPADDPIQAWMTEQNIRVRNNPLPIRDKWKPFHWFIGVSRLTSILRQERVDVIHVNHTFCYQAAGEAGRRLGIPRLCYLQNEVHQVDLGWTFSAGLECMVSLTKYLEDGLRQAWPADRIPHPKYETLLSGMAMPPRQDRPARALAQSNALNRLGLTGDRTTLGFIGMVKDIKGLAELLQTLAVVREQQPDFKWQLVVAGADPDPQQAYINRCRQLADELQLTDHVRFLGYLDDTSEFYHAIDVAIIPSLIEPMGRISHEAAKFSKPSIAFASGGIPETIEERESDGFERTGWMVSTGDIQALAGAISYAARDAELLIRTGEAARNRVETVVDPLRHNQRLARIYAGLAGRQPASPKLDEIAATAGT